MPPTDAALLPAITAIRGHTTADIRFGENLRDIKYVSDPASGRLVAPVMVAMIRAVDTVLFVPEFADGAAEVLVTLEQFEETGPAGGLADRWRVYHRDPPDVQWAFMDIDAIKIDGVVYDGEAIQISNPLGGAEASIVKHMNTDHTDDLRALAKHYAAIEIDEPVMVGIDPWDIDIRGRFDVIRVPALREMEAESEVRPVLVEMTNEARGTNK